MMLDCHPDLETVVEQLNQRATAPDSLRIERNGDLLVIIKPPFNCPLNRSRCLKNPLQFSDYQYKLQRHRKAVSIIQDSRMGINKLLLPQSLIACRAKDGASFIAKVTEFYQNVRTMADIPWKEIIASRLYVKFMAIVSIFGLTQLIVYGRKYDLLEGEKFSKVPSFSRQFKSTLKSNNVFVGTDPKTGKTRVFLDADWYTHVHESKWPFLKALRNAILWSRNAILYGSVYLFHVIGILPLKRTCTFEKVQAKTGTETVAKACCRKMMQG